MNISNKDFLELKNILGNLYLANGNTREVVLLSQALDHILVSIQKTQANDISQM